MPGTLVSDALAPELLDAAIVEDTTGAAVEVAWPAECRFKLALGAIGAAVTGFDVEIQGCDSSGFSSGVVSYGRFDAVAGSDDNETRYLQARVYTRYVRAVADYTGDGSASVAAVVTVVEPHDHRVSTDSA